MKYFLFTGLVAVIGFAQPALAEENLVYNSTLENVVVGQDSRYPGGTPVGWIRGGYGMITGSHDILTCPGGYRGCPYPDANKGFQALSAENFR
jgi:hypothetical protein